MNLGRIVTAPCTNTPPLPDARCNDPVFALLNPNICGVSSQLIVKPSVALCCLLGGVQFKSIVVSNGQEKDVTAQTTFTTSNPDVAVVGATSGNATGVADGDAIITATYGALTSSASMSVLGSDGNCCDDIKVGLMVLLDTSKSMTQAFGGSYSRKLDFAKSAAKRFIGEVNSTKDVVGLATFDDLTYTPLSGLVGTPATVAALVDAIDSAQQLTGYKAAVNAAIATLTAATLDSRVLVVISDGADTSATANDASDTLAVLNAFKANGGSVIVLGTRTAGMEFSFLETFSTGGFFVNSYSAISADALNFFSGLKGYLCAGNCVPKGDDFEAKGQLNYCGFKNWNVRGGHVDLIGNGFLDFLPGNGLYVDLAGADAPHGGMMESKNSIALISGHSYRLSLSLAGNQRASGSPNTVSMKIFGRNNDGLADPNTVPAIIINESGAPLSSTPTYKYAYTHLNANGETAPSPVSTATPTTANASVTVQATASNTATAINIYRTTGAAFDDRYYLIATIAKTAPAYVDHMNETDMLAAFLTGALDDCTTAPVTNTTGSQVNYLNQSVTINDYQQGFQPQSFTFTAPDNIAVWIRFQQTDTPAAAPSAGLLLDNVSFDDMTNIENLLNDDFSGENLTYIPPACGLGSSYVAYGTPQQLSSLIPEMTGYTTPSGIAAASSENNPALPAWAAFQDIVTPSIWWVAASTGNEWLSYKFAFPVVVNAFFPTAMAGGENSNYTFEASHDGASWVVLYTAVGKPATLSAPVLFSNQTPYLYYRIHFTSFVSIAGSPNVNMLLLKMYNVSGGYGYGFISGYYGCYGSGCLDTPPAVQLPDPNPLPNIEAPGYTPPKQFTSIQQACVTCPNGGTQVQVDNNGVGTYTKLESADGSYAVFDVPPILYLVCWTFTPSASFTLSLLGSNDGVNWQKIYMTTGHGYAANANGNADLGAVSGSCSSFDPVQFKYFKLVYDKTKAVLNLYSFAGLKFSPASTLCKSATATSLVSQADADAKALAQATAQANSAIQCITAYSATESFTAVCPIGKSGQSVTQTKTYISLISLQDAQVQALAQATAAAQAALTCVCADTSTGKITINDFAAASPYPAVKCVSGAVGHVTKVTATISGFQHTYPNDVSIMLVSPKGTLVNLMRNCGGVVNVSGINLTFDDAAGSSLNGASMASGTFKPTQLGIFNAFPQPCPSGTPNAALSAFIGEDPNGPWLLFVQDAKQLDVGQISGGFSLNITSA